jgi:xylulokinase
VLEGVAFAAADGLDALEDAGTEVGDITVIGGGARSAWWGRVLSAALQRRLVYREGSELGPAYGAARLARLCVTGEPIEVVCIQPHVRDVIEPDDRDVDMLSGKRQLHAGLYQDLRLRFQEAGNG